MNLKEVNQVAQDRLQTLIDGIAVKSGLELESIARAIVKCSLPWSRSTIVLLSPADVVSVAADDDGLRAAAPGRYDDLPSLSVRQDGSDAKALRVSGESNMAHVLHASAQGKALIPVVLTFPDSPGRTDDGFWALMRELPTRILGRREHFENEIAAPHLPVTAQSVGLDDDVCLAVGVACDAVNAVATFSPRTPEAAGHPAGDAAEERAATKDIDTLMSMSDEDRFKLAWHLVRSRPELLRPNSGLSMAA